ncbi:MAG: DUF4430 domain-containing protein [Clostridiales bacterium]|nr:DUF4430 domain-containing protein [Clostridiales bacterium]
MFWKKHKWKIVTGVCVVALLAAAFWYGGGAPGLQGWKVQKPGTSVSQSPDKAPDSNQSADALDSGSESPGNTGANEGGSEPGSAPAEGSKLPGGSSDADNAAAPEGIESRPGGLEGGLSAEEKIALAKELAGGEPSPGVEQGSVEYSEEQGMNIDSVTGKDKYLTDPVPEGKPIPVEPQDVEVGVTEFTCTISISCSTINDNISWLDPEKVELVPEDGWILPATEVVFYEGESVFNVLWRTCKQNGIHMEFENTPIYNSAYIEGINNIYEFDCGELSGWMYKVNEWFPNYGSSRYQLKDGDVICWVYTCNLGFDVGGGYAIGE